MIADLVYETTTSTGTGPVTLLGAFNADFRTFLAGGAVGSKRHYAIRGGGQWEVGEGTLTANNVLTRTTVFNGSSGKGVPVNFTAGTKHVYETLHSGSLLDISTLPVASAVADNAKILMLDTDNLLKLLPGSLVKSTGTNTPPTADTTAPTFPDSLSSSNVTQTAFRLSWQAAADANGIAKYEYSFDGSTWISAGAALFVDITGRTANTSHTMRVRAVDPAGNTSTMRQLVVVTQAAAGNQAPSMSGSLSVTNQSSNGYTLSWSAGTDPDGNLAGYDYSINAGATWTQLGNVLTVNVTDRPAANTDNVRVRARDSTGVTSNVLSATATTTIASITYDTFSVLTYVNASGTNPVTYTGNGAATAEHHNGGGIWDKKFDTNVDGWAILESDGNSTSIFGVASVAATGMQGQNYATLALANYYSTGFNYELLKGSAAPVPYTGNPTVNAIKPVIGDRIKIERTNSASGGNNATLTISVARAASPNTFVPVITATNFPAGELALHWYIRGTPAVTKLQSSGLVAR